MDGRYQFPIVILVSGSAASSDSQSAMKVRCLSYVHVKQGAKLIALRPCRVSKKPSFANIVVAGPCDFQNSQHNPEVFGNVLGQ